MGGRADEGGEREIAGNVYYEEYVKLITVHYASPFNF